MFVSKPEPESGNRVLHTPHGKVLDTCGRCSSGPTAAAMPLHTPGYDFKDAGLPHGVAFIRALARDRLTPLTD